MTVSIICYVHDSNTIFLDPVKQTMHKKDRVKNSQNKGRRWNIFILFYLILSIVLLTLYPYQFQPFSASEQWKWEFTLQDFTRNVLFFAPFGLVVRHLFRKPHGFSLLAGLLLSFSVETTQLFLSIRASNFSDLLSNGTGTLLGSLFHQWAFASSLPGTVGIPFAFMLLPLCWTVALRADLETTATWAIVPVLLAGLVLLHTIVFASDFKSSQSKGSQSKGSQSEDNKKSIIIALWCIVVLLPLVSVFHLTGFVFVAVVPLALKQIQQLSPQAKKRLVLAALLSGFIFAASINGIWYFTTPNPIWKPSNPIWNIGSSLRLIEVVLSGIAALSSRFLIEQMPELWPGQEPVR